MSKSRIHSGSSELQEIDNNNSRSGPPLSSPTGTATNIWDGDLQHELERIRDINVNANTFLDLSPQQGTALHQASATYNTEYSRYQRYTKAKSRLLEAIRSAVPKAYLPRAVYDRANNPCWLLGHLESSATTKQVDTIPVMMLALRRSVPVSNSSDEINIKLSSKKKGREC